MNIWYVANIRFPTEKAHGLQIAYTCAALKKEGAEVTLVIPRRPNTISIPWTEYYTLPETFSVVYLSVPFWLPGTLGYIINEWLFARKAKKYLQGKEGVIYTRDERVAGYLKNLNLPLFWEAHLGYTNRAIKKLIPKLSGLVAITKNLADLYNMPKEKTHVSPDGYDPEKIKEGNKQEARIALNIPQDAKVVVSTANLYPWKGVHVLARAAALVDPSITIVMVGGPEDLVPAFKETYKHIPNLLIRGHRPYKEIPLYLAAADVLVIPNIPEHDTSALYTSPMKLFEYMAAGRPIIASDLPSLREIIDESTAVMVPAGDEALLAQAITEVVHEENNERVERALKEVSRYTWQKRAQGILSFIESRI